jgi:hypothetical protein
MIASQVPVILGLAIMMNLIVSIVPLESVFGFNGTAIYTNKDVVKNTTYPQHSSQYWNWIHSIPGPITPRGIDTYKAEGCGLNQNYSAFYLADAFHMEDNSRPSERDCTIPHGKSIFMQIVGSGCSYAQGITTYQGLVECAEWIFKDPNKLLEFSVYLDENPIIDTYLNNSDEKYMDLFLVDLYPTNMTIYPKDLFEDKPGKDWPAMTYGYFLHIKPLEKGTHNLTIKSDISLQDFEDPNKEKKMNLLYNLTIS